MTRLNTSQMIGMPIGTRKYRTSNKISPARILPNRRKANVKGLVISSIRLMITNGAKGLKKLLKCFLNPWFFKAIKWTIKEDTSARATVVFKSFVGEARISGFGIMPNSLANRMNKNMVNKTDTTWPYFGPNVSLN